MNPPSTSMPLDVSKSNSTSSSPSSPCLSIIFVAISIITLILEIITFTQHWWPDLTPFAAKIGPDNNYVNVSPTCSVSYMGRSQNIASDGNCTSYNVIKAFLLLAHFAGIACTILLLLCIFAPSCHLRLPIRTMAVSVAITMIVAFICNLIAMFVFIANEQRDQRKYPSYYYNYRFSWQAGFILFIVVVAFQGVLCLLLIPTVRSLMRMKQINQNMPQLQQQALYAPQSQYQPYQQPPQYQPQYYPPQPFVNPPPASAPAPPSADAGVFVPIPGTNAYLYYPPGQSLAGAQQHVQALQTQMQTNVPTQM